MERIDTLVVGGGQAGIAMSEHLKNAGIHHLILEKDRVAERWRTGRWDSLVANGPAWHDRFPGLEFADTHPDGFPSKESIADYFVEYANRIDAPVRCGVEVTKVEKYSGNPGFRVETSSGLMTANNIVVATGPFQNPIIPPIIPVETRLMQIHSYHYRNPKQLPEGAVLVIGAGSSGTQIADELLRCGKKVFLSVGPHERPPRTYRGRDFCWWLGVLGKWDMATPEPGTEHVTIAVSGAYGGRTIDFRSLSRQGMKLLGMTKSYANGVVHFNQDLEENISKGDAYYLALLKEADDYVLANGVDLPVEPEAHEIEPDTECLTKPVLELNLANAEVSSIIWATGFSNNYDWLKVDVFDLNGNPNHQRGVSSESGIYFLGLPWLSRRGSSFIWGVWHDAKYVADHISTMRNYLTYRSPKGNCPVDGRTGNAQST